MLRTAMLLTGFVTVIVLATAQEKGLAEAKAYDDVEAYKVYSAILPNEWPSRAADATTLVIRTETEPYAMCIVPDKESERVVGECNRRLQEKEPNEMATSAAVPD